MVKITGNLIIFICAVTSGYAQISITVSGGFVSSIDKNDQYGLNVAWSGITSGGGTSGSGLVFLSGSSGGASQMNIMWEASKIFSVGFLYQRISFSTSDSKRTAAGTNLGPVIKINFARNTRKIFPFFQLAYTFSNQTILSQEKVTSTRYPSEIQPSFSNQSTSTDFGFMADLGAEVRITNSFNFIFTSGLHGFQLADDAWAKNLLSTLSYGNYQKPDYLDGAFYIQISGGLKYYFGRQKKKRDF